MNIVWISTAVLAAIGVIAALLLYFVSQKFKVEEDPMIDEVLELLPGANCGGCGFAGCKNFAEFVVKNKGLNGKICTAGGKNNEIAQLFGGQASQAVKTKMVLRCNGTCENAPAKLHYDSIASCAFANSVSAGERGCMYGCIGCGDCVKSCQFGGITIDPNTHLPVFNTEICVSCGSCAKACPRGLIVAVPVTDNGVVWVACANKEKGVDAKKNCSAACIGCMKCAKNCEQGAVTVTNNLAQINDKCIACGKCYEGCPTKAIHMEKEEIIAEKEKN